MAQGKSASDQVMEMHVLARRSRVMIPAWVLLDEGESDYRSVGSFDDDLPPEIDRVRRALGLSTKLFLASPSGEVPRPSFWTIENIEYFYLSRTINSRWRRRTPEKRALSGGAWVWPVQTEAQAATAMGELLVSGGVDAKDWLNGPDRMVNFAVPGQVSFVASRSGSSAEGILTAVRYVDLFCDHGEPIEASFSVKLYFLYVVRDARKRQLASALGAALLQQIEQDLSRIVRRMRIVKCDIPISLRLAADDVTMGGRRFAQNFYRSFEDVRDFVSDCEGGHLEDGIAAEFDGLIGL